jgi:lysophospholipase L1-like esterase
MLKFPTHRRQALWRRLLSLGVLSAIPVMRASPAEPAPFYLRDGDRVVFYGDSITEQTFWGAGAYADYAENYVLTRFPGMRVEFTNSGWGGDAVSWSGGGAVDVRVQRDIVAHRPTVVTIMLGMNDGKYQPFDPAVFKTYRDGYRHIVGTLLRELPGVRLTLIEPSPYDDITRQPVFEGGYNAVLLRFSAFVGELATQTGQNVADFNTPVVAMLKLAKQADPTLAQKIIGDRIHPGPGAHLIMAEALLRSWNAPALVSDVEIDSDRGEVKARGARVTDLGLTGVVSWTETDDSLPMPVDLSDPATALAVANSDFFDALDRETLKVGGLKAAAYSLRIDGAAVGVFKREELAAGVNLARYSTPMTRQAAEVRRLTARRDHFRSVGWHSIEVTLFQGGPSEAIERAVPPLLRAIDAEEAALVAQRRAAAQPVPHHFELAPQ